ncbi:anhydro-N-acetylmuramic acid kinase [Ketobacter sp.]|uniref:anhydro-N-acetylmuramic acid kinase n=1 Tax=Ketobacter sp. TaxID=2083498 RepID=UPI000F16BDA7|nr:anhydro-N-acetylmuramic acid kinase [Ketobacter sp.]RLT99413.1 MAG: anhydro-N-acetylmuramic acid kinase [Ketobacter sp.]
MRPDDLYIGLISGTSADGIDAALVSFDEPEPKLLAHHLHPIPTNTRARLISLFTPDHHQIDLMGELDVELGRLFASAVAELLALSDTSANAITAIGSHGQTIRHRPEGKHPFTLQVGDPNVIAQLTGIDVVADFRRRDMACGGQGAPLAPLFHAATLAHDRENRVVLNLGGIANITWLPAQGQPLAMDTGPASGLMDSWCQLHRGETFDDDGQWAAQGAVNQQLLAGWLADPYFAMPAPKSTGKEYFHLEWARSRAGALFDAVDPADLQATLLELTARTATQAIQALPVAADRILVCGGGVHNSQLMARLQALNPCPVADSSTVGIAADWVEAMCFAWLGKCHIEGRKLNTSPFTGARDAVLLGGLYRS